MREVSLGIVDLSLLKLCIMRLHRIDSYKHLELQFNQSNISNFLTRELFASSAYTKIKPSKIWTHLTNRRSGWREEFRDLRIPCGLINDKM